MGASLANQYLTQAVGELVTAIWATSWPILSHAAEHSQRFSPSFLWSSFRLATFGWQRFNPVKVRPGPQEEGLACHRGRGHEAVAERIRRQNLQSAAGLENPGGTLLIEKIKPPVRKDWRSRV